MNTLNTYVQMINRRLEDIPVYVKEEHFGDGEIPWLLSHSMRYSLCAGGKRLRPCMMLAAVEMLGGNIEKALDFACAVEMIHTYSLIHDDLPGMDNDNLRRGIPTNHVVYGEGQAILAGDGLLNCAFETMLSAACADMQHSEDYLLAMHEIATGSGVTGMVAGQVMDLYCEKSHRSDVHVLEYIQYCKTACMFIYPLRAAARICRACDTDLIALTDYGRAFGMMFQATDDLLDVIGVEKNMGKTLGKDAETGKVTCVSVYGIDGTRQKIAELHDQALDAIARFSDRANFFIELVNLMVNRIK